MRGVIVTEPFKSAGTCPWSAPVLILVLIGAPAWADAPPDLLDAHQAQTASDVLPAADAHSEATGVEAPSASWSGPKLLGIQFGAGAAAAAITVPLTLWGASAVGTLSNNLFGAALPSLLMLWVLPPLAVTLAEVLVGNLFGAGAKLFPALWAALGTQLVAIVGGVLLGLYSGNPTHVALFTLGEAILLPTATTLVLAFSEQSATPPLSGVERATSRLPSVISMPVLQGTF